MSSLRGYTEYVPDVNVKKNLPFGFWQRRAVSWTCSRAQMKEAIDAANEVDKSDLDGGTDYLLAAMIICACYLGLIGFPIFFIFCIVVKCRSSCCLPLLTGLTLGFEFVMGVLCMAFAVVANGKN